MSTEEFASTSLEDLGVNLAPDTATSTIPLVPGGGVQLQPQIAGGLNASVGYAAPPAIVRKVQGGVGAEGSGSLMSMVKGLLTKEKMAQAISVGIAAFAALYAEKMPFFEKMSGKMNATLLKILLAIVVFFAITMLSESVLGTSA